MRTSMQFLLSENSHYVAYTEPTDAYNYIATDLNDMKNFNSYRLTIPEQGTSYIEFVAHDLYDKGCTKPIFIESIIPSTRN